MVWVWVAADFELPTRLTGSGPLKVCLEIIGFGGVAGPAGPIGILIWWPHDCRHG